MQLCSTLLLKGMTGTNKPRANKWCHHVWVFGMYCTIIFLTVGRLAELHGQLSGVRCLLQAHSCLHPCAAGSRRFPVGLCLHGTTADADLCRVHSAIRRGQRSASAQVCTIATRRPPVSVRPATSVRRVHRFQQGLAQSRLTSGSESKPSPHPTLQSPKLVPNDLNKWPAFPTTI